MFAYFRSQKDQSQSQLQLHFFLEFISNKMRANLRASASPLSGLDVSNIEVATMLAQIYMCEFECTMNTLNQVHRIAACYHEKAFDNLDKYIDNTRPAQLAPHEMTAEQRHASQVLVGVGQRYSEVNISLKNIELSSRDIENFNTNNEKIIFVAKQFQESRTTVEDAFDRLNHVSKEVWSLVNMLAFSNLFRFADPRQPICIPNTSDAIFIPHIPTNPHMR